MEYGIDWLEQLENLKARQGREATLRENVAYANRLRNMLVALSDSIGAERIVEHHCKAIADLTENIKKRRRKRSMARMPAPCAYGALALAIRQPKVATR